MTKIAEVIVDIPTGQTNRPFDYLIPGELSGEVQVGSRVLVPFGPQKRMGFVIRLKDEADSSYLKPIADVMDAMPPLTPELIAIGMRMAEEYVCHCITAFQAMLPAVLKGNYRKVIKPGPEFAKWTQDLSLLAEAPFWQTLEARGRIDWEEALSQMSRSKLSRLRQEGYIVVEEFVGDRTTSKTVWWVKPQSREKIKETLQTLSSRASKQKEILTFFLEHPEEVLLSELLAKTGATRSVVKRLVELGCLTWEEREVFRDPYADRLFAKSEPLTLTEEQMHAFSAICQAMERGAQETFLLHGVTGSGKTEIYLQAIDKILKMGKEAIVLVPEISLTPQMVERFKSRFGSQVAVLHSGLSSGERFDEWRKIRLGEVKVAIGARSAIFAPFTRLGLIIMDEEHETSYKQEENPKYHAREIALWRAKFHQAVLILGSATPSLESFALAEEKRFVYLPLRHRVQNRPLPEVEIVDLRQELKNGNRSMFSAKLREELLACVNRGEQAVLFLNRRGHSTFVMCRECGETLTCPHCDVSLTYHQTNRTVRCHYCGFAESVPTSCPKCESKHIRYFGTGTQKVEEELMRHFPGLRVIRMDVDTTGRKGAHEKLLTAFREGKADVLLGTQMIAKGLDFPKVTLVGVIAADSMLHLPDFRAAERTFQLLTQVSGRAGRHEAKGKVVIQTYHPEHYAVELAALHRVKEFYRQECALRKQSHYPPYFGLITILFSHPDRVLLIRDTQKIAVKLQQARSWGAEVLGPVPAPIPKLKDRYRLQMMIKYPFVGETIERLKWLLQTIATMVEEKEFRIQIERDDLKGICFMEESAYGNSQDCTVSGSGIEGKSEGSYQI